MPTAGGQASDPQIANNNTAPLARSMAGPPPPRFMGDVIGADGSVAASENVVLHPAVVRAPGQTRGEPEPASAATEAEAVIAIGPSEPVDRGPTPSDKTVTVEAVRETLTFTMPMEEAALPVSLIKSLEAQTTDIDSEPASIELSKAGTHSDPSALPPPLPASAASTSAPGRSSFSELAVDGDDTRSMALRLRPPGRET